MLIWWGGFWPIILQPYFRVVNTNLIRSFLSMVEIPEIPKSQNACLSKRTSLKNTQRVGCVSFGNKYSHNYCGFQSNRCTFIV